MAKRRMFTLDIVDSDAFLDMSQTAQCLYFHLAMRADDDGFVNNARKIMRMTGCQEDDFKVLLAKRFLIPFESGVCVIKHWKMHNYIQKDRYKETKYIEEKDSIKVKSNGSYTECVQIGDTGKVRLGKDRLGKVSQGKILSEQSPPIKYSIKDKELAELLFDLIRGNNPTHKEPDLDKWAEVVERTHRIDKRTYEEIEFIIIWCQKSDFWQANILSTSKLREKFDQLVAQSKRDFNSNKILVI